MSEENKIKAWIVPVRTTRLGGGQPMLVCYVAGYKNPIDAQEAVKQHVEVLEGDDVGEPSPLSDGTVDALRVRSSDVWML